MKPIGSNSPDLILRSPAKRSEAGRLEGWQLARPSPAAILRDASLTRCSSGWGRGGCRYDSKFGNAAPGSLSGGQNISMECL